MPVSYTHLGQDFNISYDHVSFAYQTTQPGPDGKPIIAENEVLHDITLVAKAGQKTALVLSLIHI